MAGGAAGAPCRFWIDTAIARGTGRPAWVGTLAVNVIGCLVLGLVVGWASSRPDHEWVAQLAGTGFCGALTTFSTFSVQTWTLIEAGHGRTAMAVVGANTIVGGAAAATGLVLTGAW
jgi:CrcB protein